jgi:hypothetical protein
MKEFRSKYGWRGVVVLVLVILCAFLVPAFAAYRSAAWKYNEGDLWGTDCLQSAIDNLDGRLDGLGVTATGTTVAIAGDLTVAGAQTNTGTLTCRTNLIVNGRAAIAGDLTVAGAQTNTGKLACLTNVAIAGDVTVAGTQTNTGKLACLSNLTVAGAQTNMGELTCLTNLIVNGRVTINGTVGGVSTNCDYSVGVLTLATGTTNTLRLAVTNGFLYVVGITPW